MDDNPRCAVGGWVIADIGGMKVPVKVIRFEDHGATVRFADGRVRFVTKWSRGPGYSEP